jgi:hypothetical protein
MTLRSTLVAATAIGVSFACPARAADFGTSYHVTGYSCSNNYQCDGVYGAARRGDSRATFSMLNTYDRPGTLAVAKTLFDSAAYLRETDMVLIDQLGWFKVEDTCQACASDPAGRVDVWMAYATDDEANAITRITASDGAPYHIWVYHSTETPPAAQRAQFAGASWRATMYTAGDALHMGSNKGIWLDAGQQIWADRMVDGLVAQGSQGSHNSYVSPATAAHWGPWDGTASYENHNQCASFLTQMFKKAYDLTDAYYSLWFGSTSPYAVDYYNKILAQQGFTRITAVRQLAAGDVLARSDVGHVGHVITLEPYSATEFLHPLPGTSDQWYVAAIDSSSSYHTAFDSTLGKGDTRYLSSSLQYEGAGRGYIRIQANPDGTLANYAWSETASTVYTDIAAGRIYDVPNH